MRLFDRDATHQHALAVVVRARTDAEHPPQLREAAVSGHQQPRAHPVAAFPRQGNLPAVANHAGHALPGQQLHACLRRHQLVRGAADQVIGHQPAQLPAATVGRAHAQPAVRIAVDHLGIAQLGHLACIEALPQAQPHQDLARGMGQRDLAAVEGRLGDRRQRLLLDQRDRQPAACKRACETQAGRPCTDDGDVDIHAVRFPLGGSASLPRQRRAAH